ncbi:CLUMA_CG017366, isoform A [Clunio marinus]|uniref:CLUMA_CG017366, isoform A n=1 Tax=Clunio marinus TaxID=568069 RepID=A0A1J1IXG3_9DIPT|nr:CLUMA_CG017366, isoform A [Clunio marinus]
MLESCGHRIELQAMMKTLRRMCRKVKALLRHLSTYFLSTTLERSFIAVHDPIHEKAIRIHKESQEEQQEKGTRDETIMNSKQRNFGFLTYLIKFLRNSFGQSYISRWHITSIQEGFNVENLVAIFRF